jgi:hypothetical protein
MEADVLQDCLGELKYLYNESVGKYFNKDLEKNLK